MKYQIDPYGDKWTLSKDGVYCGVFPTEKLAKDNQKVREDLDRAKNKFKEEKG